MSDKPRSVSDKQKERSEKLEAQIRDAVQAWLMRDARRHFTARLDHFAPLLGVPHVAPPTKLADGRAL